jgi:hypothetical protein
MLKVSPLLASAAWNCTNLNGCYRFRGFVYQRAHFSANKKSIEVVVRPRKGSAAVCSRCHLPAPGYDQLAETCHLQNRTTLGDARIKIRVRAGLRKLDLKRSLRPVTRHAELVKSPCA